MIQSPLAYHDSDKNLVGSVDTAKK